MLPRSRLLVIEWFHNWWRVDWCRVELWEQNRCYWWYRSWNGRACGQLSAWIWRWINWLHSPRCISELVSLLWMPLATLVKYQWRWLVQIHGVIFGRLRSFRILVHCLFLWLMISTWLGQVSMSMTKSNCWHSTSIWWAWLWINCRSRHTRSIHLIPELKQECIPYYSTHLCFKCNGICPFITPYPPFKYRTSTNLHLHWKWAA